MRPLLLLSLLALPASAAEWKASFPPDAIGTYLAGTQRSLLVAGAGSSAAEAHLAATALRLALNDCGKAKLVMDDAGLGNLEAADDAEVVSKAAALPVELVAVVRVFPSGGEPSVVVTLYDKAGGVQMAFSTTRGLAVQSHAGSGASTGHALSPSRAAAAPPPPPPSRQEQQFLEHQLTGGGHLSAFAPVAFEGQVFHGLVGGDFYRTVGREDLARAYSTRLGVKVTATTLGLASMLAGAVVWAATSSVRCVRYDQSPTGTCLQQEVLGQPLLSLGIIGAGLAATLFGSLWPAHPLDDGAAKGLIDTYNQSLKDKPALTVVPVLSSNGAALTVAGVF